MLRSDVDGSATEGSPWRNGRLIPAALGAVGVAALLVGGVLFWRGQQPTVKIDSAASTLVGQPQVRFRGSDLANHEIDSSVAGGRPLLIDFWASWCVPCRREQPFLNRINADGAGRGVRVMGVNVDDAQSSAISFDLEFGVRYQSLYDREGRLYHAYGVGLLPSLVLVDRSGKVVGRLSGEQDEAAVRSLIGAKLR
ncbi:MAG: TlpA family protein disulfide reductase [Candidatus Dormibacteria bacterium]